MYLTFSHVPVKVLVACDANVPADVQLEPSLDTCSVSVVVGLYELELEYNEKLVNVTASESVNRTYLVPELERDDVCQ